MPGNVDLDFFKKIYQSLLHWENIYFYFFGLMNISPPPQKKKKTTNEQTKPSNDMTQENVLGLK